jgi:hypothetical protein
VTAPSSIARIQCVVSLTVPSIVQVTLASTPARTRNSAVKIGRSATAILSSALIETPLSSTQACSASGQHAATMPRIRDVAVPRGQLVTAVS